MNSKELNDLIKDIFDRSNPKYTSPSGAFLEFLRELAKDRKIESIAESCSVYCESHPAARHFLVARIPGILVNHYFTINEDLDFEKFIEFTINTRNWADGIEKTIFSPIDFKNEINNVIKKCK